MSLPVLFLTHRNQHIAKLYHDTKDVYLDKKLEAEAEGVLAMALEAYAGVLKRLVACGSLGAFSLPANKITCASWADEFNLRKRVPKGAQVSTIL